MKVFDPNYQAHLNTRSTRVAYGMRVTKKGSGEVLGFTSHDRATLIEGVDYSAAQGLLVSQINTNASLAVGNLELTTLHDGTLFTLADIKNRVWAGAEFEIFRYVWDDLSIQAEVLIVGTFGELHLMKRTIKIELRDLRQPLQQPVGMQSTRTCPHRLGDSRCTKNLTAFTFTGAITAVTSNRVFTDSSRAQTTDYFTYGLFTWTSGANLGAPAMWIMGYETGGIFTLAIPTGLAVLPGDTYSVVAGCDKTLPTCRDKFENVINYGGQWHRPKVDDITKPVVVDV